MNAGVAVKIDTDEDRDYWTRLLEAFGISTVYELPGLGVPLGDSIMIENAAQISNFQAAPLVVIQPIDGPEGHACAGRERGARPRAPQT